MSTSPVSLPSQPSPPAFALTESAPSLRDHPVVAVAVLVENDELLLGPGSAELCEELDVDFFEVLTTERAEGAAGEVVSLPTTRGQVLLVGVGAGSPDELRRAGAALSRRTRGLSAVASSVAAVGDDSGLTAFVAGLTLGSFTFTMRTTNPPPAPVASVLLTCCAASESVLDRAVAIARASWQARLLATVPSNIKNPQWLVEQGIAVAERAGLGHRVWDEKELAEQGFGGLIGVGQGSASPPRLLRLDYSPPKPNRHTPHLVLVGKGITFDSGGLSIKPAEAMSTMKRDMTGAAVVLAVMSALSAVDCPVRVTGLLVCAENSVGANSMRPGDVITHYGGRTSEVTNTDAEGRLVLADGLAYAVAELKPDALVDVATLTGAMKVALGLHLGGFCASEEALSEAVLKAASESGERMWRLPLATEYEALLASKVADADNAPGGAGAITAALFLQHFTGGLPWVHLDIASVGDAQKDTDEWTTGPTGFGVRLLLHWLGSQAPLEGIAG